MGGSQVKRKSRTTLRNKADKLFSLAIRNRDDHCLACGSAFRLQCAHIVSRRYGATRWSMDNAVCLCARCHLKYTHDPLGWEEWVDDRFGKGRLVQLKLRARQGVAKVDLEAVVESLK